MKPLIITLAFLLIMPFTVAAEPPAPGLTIAVDCDPCADGDVATVTLHVTTPVERAVRVVGVIRHASGAVLRSVSPFDVFLPTGVSEIVLARGVVCCVEPGVYLIEGALTDPASGTTLARAVVGVTKQ